jgi:hypothetical protein
MSNYEILTGEELYEQELNTERRVKPVKTGIRDGSQRYYTMGGFEQLRFWQPPQPPYMQFAKAIL